MKLICLMNYYWLQDKWVSFNNNMSTYIKVSKAQTSKIIQSRGFLESLLSKLVGPIMKVAVPLVKKLLALLGITAATSATDAGI